MLEASLSYADTLKPMVSDVVSDLSELRRTEANVLFEGAQGALLDIDHGTYPFVTSSNTAAGAIGSGCGVGPLDLDYILGITKAYTTRVGSGPFPTELFDEVGSHLAKWVMNSAQLPGGRGDVGGSMDTRLSRLPTSIVCRVFA